MVKLKTDAKRIYIYEYLCADNLLCSCEYLYKSAATRHLKSDLYSLNRKYRLLIFARSYEISDVNETFEFADRILHTAEDLSTTLEYWRPITKNHAIEKIGRAIAL